MTVATPLDVLTGYTIGVTAARRREELGAALERRGADVVYAPAIRIVPLADDAETLAATQACVDDPPDIVVVTTGIGFRGWMEAADGWGLADALHKHLASAEVVARGPKARGAVRAAGLTEHWSPASESTSEVLGHLLTRDLDGLRIAVQLHGEPVPDLVEALEAAGAQVVQVPVYRWLPAEDVAPLHRLLASVAARQLEAVAFTSAPAAVSFLRTAEEDGIGGAVLDALRTDVLACCVGPVTAAPLQRADVPVHVPDRPRLGALIREIAAAVPARCGRTLPVAGHQLELRGTLAAVDGVPAPVGPAGMTLLRTLARHPGRVVPRTELRAGTGDDHAVEVAIGRLRAALGDPRIVQTVVKRGYRLAYEPERACG